MISTETVIISNLKQLGNAFWKRNLEPYVAREHDPNGDFYLCLT